MEGCLEGCLEGLLVIIWWFGKYCSALRGNAALALFGLDSYNIWSISYLGISLELILDPYRMGDNGHQLLSKMTQNSIPPSAQL